MTRRRIGILGYNGIQALDVIGPAEAFGAVPAENGVSPYEVVIVGVSGKRFVSEAGFVMHAQTPMSPSLKLDTLIVPGGSGVRLTDQGPKAAAWIKARAPHFRRIASVCTGIYALAETGLLDGRKVTTHWRFAEDVARRFPKLNVLPDAIFLKDGAFYTSAGITAGIDLALAMIEDDLGPKAALAAARELVVFLKRPGGQNQFSEPLRFQADSADRFADLVAWLAGHLDGDLSVEALAAKVFLSPRQFSRSFKQAYGTSPADFVETARLGEACNRLASRRVSVERVANSVGFATADGFRRAFERRFGVSPRSYRNRFVLS
ncbi:MAG TPA: helix-turn-helix domain-containing protein [Gemmatimonadales bacterium]